MELPFTLETDLERRICTDPEWRAGAAWGTPRPGHEEGSVAAHIADVLDNIDRQGATGAPDRPPPDRAAPRHAQGPGRPVPTAHRREPPRRAGPPLCRAPPRRQGPARGDRAPRRGLQRWRAGARRRAWDRAEQRARRLLGRLGPRRDLYLAFFRADNATGSKSREPLEWFERVAARGG